MQSQNHILRLIVSCAIVFSLAVAVVFIQEFKENEKAAISQKPSSSLFLTNQHWFTD